MITLRAAIIGESNARSALYECTREIVAIAEHQQSIYFRNDKDLKSFFTL